MKKTFCIPCLIGAIIVLLLAGTGIWFITRSGTPASETPAVETPAPVASPQPFIAPLDELSIEDLLIAYGRERIEELRAQGIDIETGPCLDNAERYPDWVIDVAHNPRQPVDNLPENQCPAFAEGRATRFIELAPDGIFITKYP